MAKPRSVIVDVVRSERVCPLEKPYVLSFRTIDRVESIRVEMRLSDGRRASAEVVPLVGYSTETPAAIRRYLDEICPTLPGLDLAEARARVGGDVSRTPFATSPILTAADLLEIPEGASRSTPDLTTVLRHVVSTDNRRELVETVRQAAGEAATVKIKLSGDPGADQEVLSELRELAPTLPSSSLRLDANQSYARDDAHELLQFLASCPELRRAVSHLEQPLDAADWAGHQELVRAVPTVPLMLDESIVTDQHVTRASRIGIGAVKLKLFKQGGIREVTALATRAHSLGMKVVIGNGVATWLSNRVELMIASESPELFMLPTEANGFLKLAGYEPPL